MKNLIYISFLFFGFILLASCGEETIYPENEKIEAADIGLIGNWVSTSREVKVYQKNSNLEIDDTGNSYFYYDSIYSENVKETFSFGLESDPDKVVIEKITYNEDGSENAPVTYTGDFVLGKVNGADIPFGNKTYLLIFDSEKNHESTESNYFRSYTIEEISGNNMVITYLDTNSKAQNSKLYKINFSKQ